MSRDTERARAARGWAEFEIAQAPAMTGGWARRKKPTTKQLKDAERRWAHRSFQFIPPTDVDCAYQCGGCSFFAAFGADYGVCWNPSSPLDGCITFEHGGCVQHSEAASVVSPTP